MGLAVSGLFIYSSFFFVSLRLTAIRVVGCSRYVRDIIMMMMMMYVMIMMAALRLVHLNQGEGPLSAEYLLKEMKR